MDNNNSGLSPEAKRFRWVLFFVLGVFTYSFLTKDDYELLNNIWSNIRIIRLFVSVPCIIFGGYLILMNYIILVNNLIPGRKWSSAGPFLGGLLLAFGILMIPFPLMIKYFWWLAFLLDYTYSMFIHFLFFTEEGKEFWKSGKR